MEELRMRIEREAKAYYGDDVMAEIVPFQAITS